MDLEAFIRIWPIIVSVATVVGAAGAGRYALQVVTDRLDALTSELKETNKTLTVVSTSVAVQSATLAAHTEQDRIQFDALHEQIARVA